MNSFVFVFIHSFGRNKASRLKKIIKNYCITTNCITPGYSFYTFINSTGFIEIDIWKEIDFFCIISLFMILFILVHRSRIDGDTTQLLGGLHLREVVGQGDHRLRKRAWVRAHVHWVERRNDRTSSPPHRIWPHLSGTTFCGHFIPTKTVELQF